ncbi:hypothetical protein AB0A77_27165 [Streptomyces varsoviensis]|uniref:hypothetical protein n=1 Tax=Streptomyces varsoviensis TaxID=67373 RepID=UPI0033FF1E04
MRCCGGWSARTGRTRPPSRKPWPGWGAAPQVFVDSAKPEFVPLQNRLRELLSEAEWDAAKENTLNAHHTDPAIIREVWKAVEDFGFDGGNVLEPGSGGNFIGYAPDSAYMTGIEPDPITAGISKALCPHADIRDEGFERTRPADGTLDAAVGDRPSGTRNAEDATSAEAASNERRAKSAAPAKRDGRPHRRRAPALRGGDTGPTPKHSVPPPKGLKGNAQGR